MTCRAVSCDCNLLMTFRPMRIIVHSGSIKSGISPRLYSKNTCGRSPFFAYICQCFCLRISSAVVIYLPVLSSFLNGLVQRVELQNRGRVYTSHGQFPQFPMKFHRCELQVVYDQLDQIDAEKRCLSWRRKLMGDHRRVFTMGACTLWIQSGIMNNWLVVWNMAFMTSHILGIITPTDELIFFRGVGQPPTRQQRFAFDRNGDPAKTGKSEQRKHFVWSETWEYVAQKCRVARGIYLQPGLMGIVDCRQTRQPLEPSSIFAMGLCIPWRFNADFRD